MESIAIEFNADLWVWKCLEDLVSYNTLRSLVEDKGAVESRLLSREIISLGGEPAPPEFIQALLDEERQSISKLVAHFGSQTIVTLCTTLEVANKEFFRAWFFSHPEQLHDYLVSGEVKGVVALNDILRSADREQLLARLAAGAGETACQGKYSKVLNRVASHTKMSFPPGLDSKLQFVQELRNRIVHEKESESGNPEAIAESQETVDDAIMYLARVGLAKGVPGRYTVVVSRD